MSDNLKYLIKNILMIIFVSTITHYTAYYFGGVYEIFFPETIGGDGLFSISHEAGVYIIGLSLAYTFFLTLLFTAFGGGKKYWWIVILLIPAVAFELYFDIEHIYFPVILGVIGWASGYGVQKLITLFRRSNAAN